MALIQCAECEAKVSNKAAACPKCGAPLGKAAKKQKKEISTGSGCLIVLLVIGGLIAAVSIVSDKDGNTPRTTSPSSNEAEVPKPKKPTAQSGAAQTKPHKEQQTTSILEADQEPDWKKRFVYWREMVRGDFQPKHKVGDVIDLKLAGGDSIPCKVKEIRPDAVVASLKHGEATFDRDQIHPYMRGDFFQEDYAEIEATQRVRAERNKYLTRLAKERQQEQAKKKLLDEWLQAIVNSVDGYERVSLAGDRKTLTITVSDAWYYTPEFMKERLMEQTGEQFAVFAAGMGWRGDDPEASNYPTVYFVDVAGKRVGRHSTWGTKISK